MRAKSTRIILLTDFPEVEHPGGIIVPSAASIIRRGQSTRTMLWNMLSEEFPDGENLCDVVLAHTTYTGSGTFCGYVGNILNDHGYKSRYLNMTLSGMITFRNSMEYLFYLYQDQPYTFFPDWQTVFSGGTAVDPSDNCSEVNNLDITISSNGAPTPMSAWGWDWTHYGENVVSTYPQPDPELINRTTSIGHQGGGWPADGVSFPFGNETQTMYSGTSVVSIVSETVKQFIAPPTVSPYAWYYGDFAGVGATFGTVTATLSNEHTLYDQLVLDGAVATPTKGSRIFSIDDESGAYTATVSAVTFTVPDAYNDVGVEYVVRMRVLRTPDAGDPSLFEVWHYYTGTGVSGETITVMVPPALNSLTEFVGQCVSLISAAQLGEYDNFERLTDGEWLLDGVGAWGGWQNPMRFICGGTLSVDSFRDLPYNSDSSNTIQSNVGGGYCWGSDWRFSSASDVTYDNFEGKTDGATLASWLGGVGWAAPGIFFEHQTERAVDTFESYTAGAIATWPDGMNWSSVGEFVSDPQPIADDAFEDYATGAITTLNGGDGWQNDGYFIP